MNETNDTMVEKKKSRWRIGVAVLLFLAVLTIGEFAISAVGATWVSIFIMIAVLKAVFVLREYMHIGRLFSDEEEHS